ncbi:hypothetical protein [Neptuniibacter sp.]|uniref:hypothetical protein n=1 Tax=Neptuniibacter sp. TaxID=1962643 RepID=UPI0026357235|nr:hypothetical protein [Neptuniibacter sp.]MCP4598508.1 hypothetical protein [Neptuniibacter sp.]
MVILFPIKGQHKGGVTSLLPPLTSNDMNNMRPYDTLDDRARGGQRPGLDKWGDGDQVGAAEQPVVAMCIVTSVR